MWSVAKEFSEIMGLQLRQRPSKKVRIITTLIAVFAFVAQPLYGLVSSQIANAISPAITVTPTNMQGWMGVDDNGHGGNLSFVAGPGTSPLGTGSAQLKVDTSNQGYLLYKPGYAGLKLADISTLEYQTYVQTGNGTVAPSVQINIDRDVTDGNTAWQGRLVYEPYMNGTVTNGQWQSWNAKEGKWWLTTNTNAFDNLCGQSSPCTLSQLVGHFANIGVNGGLLAGVGFKAGSGDGWINFVGNVDAFKINDDTYDFNQNAPDLTKITFMNGPKYVRENNGSDIAAQVRTYNTTTQAEFYIDGNMNAPVAGVEHGASGAGMSEWRLTTPLGAGRHTITGQVKVDGAWYPIAGSSTVYSLDVPSASYILPNTNTNSFRASDNPVRLKIDDQFKQVKDVIFELHKDSVSGAIIGAFTVNRSQCDPRAAGNYLLCDIAASNSWVDLTEGTYAVRVKTTDLAGGGLRTNMPVSFSLAFAIDNTKPEVTSFNLENGTSGVVGNTARVSATATDGSNPVESVNFYLTTPREDGVCTGNGTKIDEYRASSADTNGKYWADLNTSGLEGVYCVSAVARDGAKSNSVVSTLKISVVPPQLPTPVITIDEPKLNSDGTYRVTGTTDTNSPIAIKGNNVPLGNATLTPNANGGWTWLMQLGALTAGEDYTIEANQEGSSTNNPAAKARVFPVPPVDATPLRTVPGQLAANTAGSFSNVAQPLDAQPVKDDDAAVLGAQTLKDSAGSDVASITASPEGWKIFGIAWYWILLAIAAVGGLGWTITAIAKRRAAQDV